MVIRYFSLGCIALTLLFQSTIQCSPEQQTAFLSKHAQAWAEYQSAQLTPEQAHVAANIIFLLYANAIADTQSRGLITPLFNISQAIRTHIINYETADEAIVMLYELMNNSAALLRMRIHLLNTLKACETYCAQEQELDALNKALIQLQEQGSGILCAWAYDNKDEASDMFSQSVEPLAQAAKNFDIVSKFFAGISAGELPVDVEEQYKDLARFDVALKAALQSAAYTDHITNLFNDITDATQNIIMLGGEIYKHYYIALYNALASQSPEALDIKLMFNINGVIPVEQRGFSLPHPDTVEQDTQRIIYFS